MSEPVMTSQLEDVERPTGPVAAAANPPVKATSTSSRAVRFRANTGP